MEDKDVLQHLLEVEAEAASLVSDAAKEADKRIAEAEKQNRLVFDAEYAKEAEALETQYKADVVGIKEEYQRQLDDFRHGLDAIKTDTDNFSRLFESFLFDGVTGGAKG